MNVEIGQDRVPRAQLLGQPVAIRRRLSELPQDLRSPLGLKAIDPACRLGHGCFSRVQRRFGLSKLALIVAVLAFDLNHLEFGIEPAVGEFAHGGALPLQKLEAGAQALDLGGGAAHLAAPRLQRARQRLAPVGERRVAGLQQRLLGGQQVGPVVGRNQGQLPSRGFRLQARHLDLAQLQPAAEFAALAAGDLAVEADEQLTGRDRLALANMDSGDPAAMRVIDDLDPAGGLYRADGLDHLIDLGPGNPAQQH
jgi:hypothetical protein